VEPEDPIGPVFDRCNKYVLTRGGEPLDWINSHRLSGVQDVAELKQTQGPDLLIQGSSTLYPQLLAAGLIDRLFLMTFPVVLGQGKRLFGSGTPSGAWKLVDHKVSTTGVTMASYEPAGAVPVGTFQMKEPSAAEQRRQERMKKEG
jgi:dihydrofolate reductase